jgi:Zn-dependent protease with chaperone function
MGNDHVQKYRVVFKGEIEEGKELQEVKERLAQLFKASPDRIEKLFIGKPVTLNRSLDAAAAQEYIAALKSLGAICYSEPMTESPPEHLSSLSAKSSKKLHGEATLSGPKIMLAAAGTILLPLVYVYLILFIADATFAHIDDNVSLLDYEPFIIGLLAYIVPMLIGILLFVSMTKFLVVQFLRKRSFTSISKQREPALFAYVEKLCRSVRSIAPSAVEVDCTVGASAHYRKGLLGLLEDDLVLTIGLPLASRMTLMEFTSLLAHEFGHFTSRLNGRLYYLLTSINRRFARTISEEDVIDQKIAGWIATGGFHIRIPLQTVQFFIWLTRKILLVFKFAGNQLSGNCLRDMEFCADEVALRIAGTEAFVSSLHTSALVAAASNQALQQLKIQKRPDDDTLPDNIVLFTSSILDQMSDDEKARIDHTALTGTGELSERHASYRERINRAKNRREKGLVQSEKAASTLFTNFEEISRNSTKRHYREVLGLHIAEGTLIPVSDYLNPTDLKIEPPKDEINVFDDV